MQNAAGVILRKRIITMFGIMPVCIFMACSYHKLIPVHKGNKASISGIEFFRLVTTYNWRKRDSLAVELIKSGDVPRFLNRFVRICTSIVDSLSGKRIRAVYYVAPDYLSIGSNKDWARVPLTPNAAQQIADELNCFLPTRKIVNDIYHQSAVKLEPVPMYAFRDSSVTMWQHHLIVEGQRKGRKGLIAGIKKDVVISGKISRDPKPQREAIYGWHKLSGIPIQPLYTGHVNWYADYACRALHLLNKLRPKPEF